MKSRLLLCFGKTGVFLLLIGLSACSNPQKVAMKSLTDSHYEFTAESFLAAAGSGDLESVSLFQEAGMPIDAVDSSGNTALIQAAANGRREMVEKLLGFGADPQQVNNAGRNALISAAAKGFDEVARLLISRGSDINAEDREGWTALTIAAYNGHKSTVEMLAGQADEDAVNEALLLASFNGDPGVIEYLLGQGAYINVRSPEGKTPLMIAAENGNMDAVRTLLQNQANPYALDDQGATAAKIAETNGHDDVRDLVLDPTLWGQSPTGEEIKDEMNSARLALGEGGTEEILDGNNLVEGGDLAEHTEGDRESPTEGSSLAVAESTAGNGPDEREVAGKIPRRDQKRNLSASARENQTRDRLVRQSKSKPMVALSGSRIISRVPGQAVVGSFVLAGYREQPLPIALNDVNEGQAGIRKLGTRQEMPVRVKEGRMIPGTDYRVNQVAKKFVSSKEGKGRLVDASRATVENVKTGLTYLLVKDADGYSSDKYAVLISPRSDYRYVVKTGDEFQSVEPGIGKKNYQVLDIRPGSVIIKDLKTGEVHSISRNGMTHPNKSGAKSGR